MNGTTTTASTPDDAWHARVCDDIASTLAAFEVDDLASLAEMFDCAVEPTAWVEAISDEADRRTGDEPGGIEIRVDYRGIVLTFPFTAGQVWEALTDLEGDVIREYEKQSAQEDAKLLREAASQLAVRISNELGPPDVWDKWPGGWMDDIESALIDAVFSANALYRGTRGGGVHAKVTAWQARRASRRSTRSLRDLVAEIDALGPEVWAAEFGSSQPSPGRPETAPGGATKAATVRQAAQLLRDMNPPVSTAAEVGPGRVEEVRRDLQRHVPGIGKATANYFLMLLGKPGVKPDRMVVRFVCETFRTPGSRRIAFVEQVVTAAAEELEVEVHELEHSIWAWQRTHRGTTQGRPVPLGER